jgi:hypothetical protein
MAPILEKVGGTVNIHEAKDHVVRYRHVPVTVHHGLGGGRKKIDSRPPCPLKQVYTVLLTVLHIHDCKHGPSDFLGPGMMMAKADSSENMTVSKSFSV